MFPHAWTSTLEFKFFESSEFEIEKHTSAEEQAKMTARNALRILMMGWQKNTTRLVSQQTFQAVFLKRDRELMRGMRVGFAEGFQHLYQELKTLGSLTEAEYEQFQLYLSNCLSLLPYSDINPYEMISIPQWIDGQWQLLDYKVTPLELTPTEGIEALFIHDQDRVFAYGLEPIQQPKAEPHLIFMGTTYPAGQGFVSQVMTDLEAFETAGKRLYRSGYKNLTQWLESQSLKAHVCGVSLGGSLSLLLAMHQGDKLSRVDALNPAGIYRPIRKSQFDRWEALSQKPKVIVQKQGNDPVSYFGEWKNDWRVLHVMPPQAKQGPNAWTDHFLNYAGFKGTIFKSIDPIADNQSRYYRNLGVYTLLRSAVYLGLFLPFRFLMLPVIRYIFKHKVQTILTIVFCLLSYLFPIFSMGMALPTAVTWLNYLLPGVITGYLGGTLGSFMVDCYQGQQRSDVSQFSFWLKQQSLLIKAIAAVVLIGVVGCLGLMTLFPYLWPLAPATTLFLIAAVPLMLYVSNKLSLGVQILFGTHQPKQVRCHEPQHIETTTSLVKRLGIFNAKSHLIQQHTKYMQGLVSKVTP